jgi:SpoVK/Ycf46/Vps4 family AAA+-type ATPase
MYGPPGTGKTLLARACAAQTEATFLKLAGPQLVQMFIGDGAKLVRDCFALAKEKAPSIIFIDELDAVGTKRFDSDKSGDREVQRTMLELLNQLDGFASDDRVKVLAATNRVDVLDPALLRSGRLDRKIEFPLPNEEARAQILKIHSRKMTVDELVNWQELARSTDEFGGAQLKAVCVEAGMIALRSGMTKISHEHYVDAIAEVQAKKKETGKLLILYIHLSSSANLFCSQFLCIIVTLYRHSQSHDLECADKAVIEMIVPVKDTFVFEPLISRRYTTSSNDFLTTPKDMVLESSICTSTDKIGIKRPRLGTWIIAR